MRRITLSACLVIMAILNAAKTFAAEVSDSDPTREWAGGEYAEYLFAKFQHDNPSLKLVIDPSELKTWSKAGSKRDKDSRHSMSSDSRLTSIGKYLVGPHLAGLLQTLQAGDPFVFTDDASMQGLDVKLRDWVLGQPVNSLYPHDLMAQALRLTNGHVVSAWALAWNVTSANWVFAQTRNYSDFVYRFKSVTGERDRWAGAARYVERTELPKKPLGVTSAPPYEQSKAIPKMQEVITKRGDDFSSIYHHIGVELLAIVVSERSGWSFVGRAFASAGALGEYANYSQTAGLKTENKKRVHNDLQAAKSGATFYKLIKGSIHPKPDTLAAGPARYLRSNSKVFGAKYLLPVGEPAGDFGQKMSSDFWAAAMSQEELMLRFTHAENYDSNAINDIVIAAGNGDSQRLHQGLQEYLDQGLPNEELNTVLLQFDSDRLVSPDQADVLHDFDSYIVASQDFLGEEAGEFTFKEAAVRQARMIEKVQTAIRQRGGPAVTALAAFKKSRAKIFCANIFAARAN